MSKVFRFCLLLLSFFILVQAVQAAPAINQRNFNNLLVDTQRQLQADRRQLQDTQKFLSQIDQDKKIQFAKFVTEGVKETNLAHSTFTLANARAAVSNIQIALADAYENLNHTQNALSELKTRSRFIAYSAKQKASEMIQELARQRAVLYQLLDQQQRRVSVLIKIRKLLERRVSILQSWHEQLKKLYRLQKQQTKRQKLFEAAQNAQQHRQKHLEQIAHLNERLNLVTATDIASLQQRAAIQFQIFELQEQSSLDQLEVFLNQLTSRLQTFTIARIQAQPVVMVSDQSDRSRRILNEVDAMIEVVIQKIALIKNHKAILKSNLEQKLFTQAQFGEYTRSLDKLISAYEEKLLALNQFKQRIQEYRKQISAYLRSQYAQRQTLPDFRVRAWLDVFSEMVILPKLLWRSLQDIAVELYYQLRQLPALITYLLSALIILLVVGWVFLRKTFMQLLRKLEETSRRFSSRVLEVIIRLVRRNLGTLLILAVLLGVMAVFNLDLGLWISVGVVFLIFRIANTLTRLWLIENQSDDQPEEQNEEGEAALRKNVYLYRGLRWVFTLAGILTIFMLFTHNLPVAYEVRVIFNKAFMILLLALSIILFRVWSELPELLVKIFLVKRTYIKRGVTVICRVLPFTLFSNAIIGLIGYVDLAWIIGSYQAITLFVFVFYMVLRGLLIDFMDVCYELMIRHFKAGWLWAQAFIRPIDVVLRIGLFISALIVLVHSYGWDTNPTFVYYFDYILHLKLFSIFGNPVTLLGLVGLVIFIAVLYWIAKWSREFAFRWLYIRAQDIGVRNSLAVFTQYAIVIAGVLIGFRVFGIDLKGMAVVFAAFAAAAGFGLRDVVSNFFSGILLLGERPFRTGDTISLGQHEGTVISSGMRSMKIRTWDRMDVIVPNSDMFTKPFVNWTHQDSIVRSTIKINIHRLDDPHRVQELMLGVLIELPSLVDDPSPEVLLKEMSDTFIEFEVRYFINLSVQKSRMRVRSEVLFAIWDCFEKNGIRAPYPQYDVKLENFKA